MTADEFEDLVDRMRDAQRRWFASRRSDFDSLRLAEKLEREVDAELCRRKSLRRQPALFDTEGE